MRKKGLEKFGSIAWDKNRGKQKEGASRYLQFDIVLDE